MMAGIPTLLWVFGYGSLVWRPGFQTGNTQVGHIEGFARRFWQGNEHHRGSPGKPGRVATLIQAPGEVTYGVALELPDEAALDYLNKREIELGGYEQRVTMFHPANTTHPPHPVLVYVATGNSSIWLGPASPAVIADQVVGSQGQAGTNVEYVVRLARWHNNNLPGVVDTHLHRVEEAVMKAIDKRGLRVEDFLSRIPGVGVEGGNDESVIIKKSTNSLVGVIQEYISKCN